MIWMWRPIFMSISWARMHCSETIQVCGVFPHGMTTAKATTSRKQTPSCCIERTSSPASAGCLNETCGMSCPWNGRKRTYPLPCSVHEKLFSHRMLCVCLHWHSKQKVLGRLDSAAGSTQRSSLYTTGGVQNKNLRQNRRFQVSNDEFGKPRSNFHCFFHWSRFCSGLFFDKHLKYIKLNEKKIEFTKMDLTYLLKVNWIINLSGCIDIPSNSEQRLHTERTRTQCIWRSYWAHGCKHCSLSVANMNMDSGYYVFTTVLLSVDMYGEIANVRL